MAAGTKDLLEQALRLPAAERAALAGDLIDSLDAEEPQPDLAELERAWADEIGRRLAGVDNGTVTPIPWSEARRRILDAAGIGDEAD